MINTALVIHLLTLVEHKVHGRHFTPFYVPECFQWVKVKISQGNMLPRFEHRLICGVIQVTRHSATVSWGR